METRQDAPIGPDGSLAGSLRAAILADGRSICAISRAAGVSHISVYKFASGKQGMKLAPAGRVAGAVGLRLEPSSGSGDRSLAGQIRAAIIADGRSIRIIASTAGVIHSSVERFVSGEGELLLATAGLLATAVGLAFMPGNPVVRIGPHDLLSGPLRVAIIADPRSCGAIARAAGIDSPTVYRFASGKQDLMLAKASPLAGAVGLRLETSSGSGDRSLAGQIRAAIIADGRSVYAISQAAGIDPALLRRLVSGEGDLKLATIGRVAGTVGLAFVPADPVARVVQPDPLSGPLRAAIIADPRSRNAIGRAARVAASKLYHFASGKHDLMLSSAGPLADAVGLRLEPSSGSGDRSLAGSLRAAIVADTRSCHAIALVAGVDPLSLRRLVSGEGDLKLATAGRVAGTVGLAFVPADPVARVVQPDPLRAAIRAAILADPRTYHAIALATGVWDNQVSSLVSGKQDMTLSIAGRVAGAVGLRLEPSSGSGDRSLAGSLRAAIVADTRSCHAIALAAGVDSPSLQRFVSGKQDLLLATAERVTGTVGLAFVSGKVQSAPGPTRRCPVELRGKGKPILVYGKRLPYMNGIAYNMLEHVVNSFHKGAGILVAELTTLTESGRLRPLTEALERPGFEPLRRLIRETKAGRNKIIEILESAPID